MTPMTLLGMRVKVDDDLPLHVPTDGENARRIVRWGLSRKVTLHREPLVRPGLKPDEAIHAYIAPEPLPDRGGRHTGVLHVSRDLHYALWRGWEVRFPFDGVGEHHLVPSGHVASLLYRVETAGLRRWNLLGRAVEIPFTPEELRP